MTLEEVPAFIEKLKEEKREREREKREKKRKNNRKWYAANLEKAKEYNRERYAANIDKVKEYNRKWYAANPEKAKELKRKWYAANPEKVKELKHKWYAANSENERSKFFKRKYGITLEERDAMFLAQGSVCAACGTDKPGSRGWHIDHCHITKKVRGIVCHNCNIALGMVKDSVETLYKLIAYLQR